MGQNAYRRRLRLCASERKYGKRQFPAAVILINRANRCRLWNTYALAEPLLSIALRTAPYNGANAPWGRPRRGDSVGAE